MTWWKTQTGVRGFGLETTQGMSIGWPNVYGNDIAGVYVVGKLTSTQFDGAYGLHLWASVSCTMCKFD